MQLLNTTPHGCEACTMDDFSDERQFVPCVLVVTIIALVVGHVYLLNILLTKKETCRIRKCCVRTRTLATQSQTTYTSIGPTPYKTPQFKVLADASQGVYFI